ncbi:hypothetical protein GPECTOR_67g320 [Gonium pectorale]|uniref:Thioesterase domain-containing protein n=1 Tax=Gonium pectorale TaxID=33097 RepID=A0A150G587_GONPE|nr:hypothetical protein GPECTOR_67g320 [Gonium pectorale]|eukprot:KXZ44480.1 hypothetical protein GPECTOR_67g320 [Gonium pectorale]
MLLTPQVPALPQEAYHPESLCFGCGPAHPDGLRLESRRMPGGGLGRLEGRARVSSKYIAFPGIINGGVVSTLLDCHGNWAAAIALMDKGCLPRPPLTLTASMEVRYLEPTPPDTDLILRSRVLSIRDAPGVGQQLRTTVEVELELLMPPAEGDAVPPVPSASTSPAVAAALGLAGAGASGFGGERLLATARGIFKRTGALRSM